MWLKDLLILPFSSRKANKSNKMKRIIDPSENVYLIQLSWKGAGRFILEDKDKLANEHGTLTETYSEPLGAKAGLSPSLRRQSRYVFVNWRLIQNVKYLDQIFRVGLWKVNDLFFNTFECQRNKSFLIQPSRHSRDSKTPKKYYFWNPVSSFWVTQILTKELGNVN